MDPILRYSHTKGLFGLMNARDVAKQAHSAGWTREEGYYTTSSAYRALAFSRYADANAAVILEPFLRDICSSQALNSALRIPVPAGLEYLPFQRAGIAYASRRHNTLFGDEPGLGKTIQAIGLANYLGFSRILVVCPAGLRLNWAAELDKWLVLNPGVNPILSSRGKVARNRINVVSYELAISLRADLACQQYDLLIMDEGHYLKNMSAKRTRNLLGGSRGDVGLIDRARYRVVLTGTPIPNRVDEAYSVVRALAPQTIDSMSYVSFLNHYAITRNTIYGEKVIGLKNSGELYRRLRSEFMVRRLKKDVLKDLPPKRYKLVVFGKEGFAKILSKERQFSAAEIVRHGVPVGSPLPAIRQEMGLAKVPLAVSYINDLMESGVEKVIAFAHHREVIDRLAHALHAWGVVVITGETSATARHKSVEAFQGPGGPRIILCNLIAGGVGITLHAAADVVFVEPSWVPGENEQAEDRAHRVGQMRGVLIHQLVVEESLDAVILGAAAQKRRNINNILQGEAV